jgi:hypothetical protein
LTISYIIPAAVFASSYVKRKKLVVAVDRGRSVISGTTATKISVQLWHEEGSMNWEDMECNGMR